MSTSISDLMAQSAAPDTTILDREISYNVTPAKYHAWKGRVDRVIALLLLIPGVPLIGLLVVLARLTTGASGIYRQRRVGKGGKVFDIYKIRTMRADAEKNGPQWSAKCDNRITRLGRVMRKLHLDELPQLANVLKGEMTLIGPRPERPEFIPILARAVDNYMDRLSVAPGVTGLAQINLPPDTTIDCVRRKIVLDREYISSANLSQDLRIFACTFVRLFGLPGEAAMRLFGLNREVSLLDEANECLSPAELQKQVEQSPSAAEEDSAKYDDQHDSSHGATLSASQKAR